MAHYQVTMKVIIQQTTHCYTNSLKIKIDQAQILNFNNHMYAWQQRRNDFGLCILYFPYFKTQLTCTPIKMAQIQNPDNTKC